MRIGSKLEIPDGYKHLSKDLSYYFVKSNAATKTVWLVYFRKRRDEWLAELVLIKRCDFEGALLSKKISEVAEASSLPPSLKRWEGVDLVAADAARLNAKRSNLAVAESRLLAIHPLLDRLPELLNAQRPQALINKIAKDAGQTPRRVNYWLFAYLCFGQSVLALYPAYAEVGHWDRAIRYGEVPYGRPHSILGRNEGIRVTEAVKQMIRESYLRLRSNAKPLSVIYREAAIGLFGCSVVTFPDGSKRLVSDGAVPCPSENQYRYWLYKLVDPDVIRDTLYGPNRRRRTQAQHQGKFSSSLRNFMEVVECDGYYCPDLPRSFITQKSLPPICIVRSVCGLTNYITGIGFSFGKETGQAYRSMQFSMAIGKKKFCELFGIEIDEGEWPGRGMPGKIILDRGPGVVMSRPSQKDIQHETAWVGIHELTPSGKGQSKPSIESSHPRFLRLEQPMEFCESTLTPIEIAVREIRRSIADNESSDASGRHTPEMLAEGIRVTPLAIASFYLARARNDANEVSYDEAVRRYLVETEASAGRDGVTFHGMSYHSSHLLESGVLHPLKRRKRLKAYFLPFCVRHIWVDVQGKIIELKSTLPVEEDDAQLYLSYDELLEAELKYGRLRSQQKLNAHAASGNQMRKFKEQTGKQWTEGTRQFKRAKESSFAPATEVTETRRQLQGEKRGRS